MLTIASFEQVTNISRNMHSQRSGSPQNRKTRSVARQVSCLRRRTTSYRGRLDDKEKIPPLDFIVIGFLR